MPVEVLAAVGDAARHPPLADPSEATDPTSGPAWWPGIGPVADELVSTLPAALRLGQLRADPSVRPWLVRGIIAPDPTNASGRAVIGHIGGHGAPGADGSVEIGYTVAEPWRRRGVATEAALAWFAWAHHQGARRARLSTTDDNAASLAIAGHLGLEPIGRVWDDHDQVWEAVFEADLPLHPT